MSFSLVFFFTSKIAFHNRAGENSISSDISLSICQSVTPTLSYSSLSHLQTSAYIHPTSRLPLNLLCTFALSLSLCVSPWSLLLSKCYEALCSVVIPRTQTTMGAPAELLVALMALLCINAPGTSSNSFGLCVCCWRQCFQTTTDIYFKTVHSVRRWRMQ